ncbi:hypothetical protein [Nocardioides plantarum]|uniref:ARB-07466-like C-terminal domain-containing protein n=1 Tax=Nocardioides plantarum TaxID=29299 RepID=A0ABV5K871_9ACTN|nr:hypothetical protein [Nocardioides plantarum]
MTRSPRPVEVLVALLAAALLLSIAPAHALVHAGAKVSLPLEDLARYEEPGDCTPTVKPGTRVLSSWLVQHYASRTTMTRACEWGEHVTSEHQEGRAIDWFSDAATSKGMRASRRLIDGLVAPDRWGNVAVRARRMGIMYIIWNDHIYSAWNGFRPGPYLHSGCKTLTKCSKTLRHRDHVHISLTRAAARGKTSWFDGRLEK